MIDLRIKYLIVGVANTIFGYTTGVLLYKLSNGYLDIIIIGLVTNIVNVTISFIMYKLFVFKSKEMWVKEYVRFIGLNSLTALLSIILLWLFVKVLDINIEIAQALILMITIFISYFGNLLFAFKSKEGNL